jgi:hypothetical protein
MGKGDLPLFYLMSDTKLHKELMEKPLKVYEIFKDFFGENLVDLQGFPNLIPESPALGASSYFGYIIVRFPHVTVTNEHDRSVDIKEVYAKLKIDHTGSLVGKFQLSRAHFPMSHIRSDYTHSHIPGIPSSSIPFLDPCLGSGPINHTINSLNVDFDEDLWNLFCLELQKYVSTESVSGVPYRYLEHIGVDRFSSSVNTFNIYHRGELPRHYNNTLYKRFLREVSFSSLRFKYHNNEWQFAMSYTKYLILISNLFIQWFNNLPKVERESYRVALQNFIAEYKICNNKIYTTSNTVTNNRSSIEGLQICTFKGEPVKVVVEREVSAVENTVLLIIPQIANKILTDILNLVNWKYGNNENEPLDGRGYYVL